MILSAATAVNYSFNRKKRLAGLKHGINDIPLPSNLWIAKECTLPCQHLDDVIVISAHEDVAGNSGVDSEVGLQVEHVVYCPLPQRGVFHYKVKRGQQLLVPHQGLRARALRGHYVQECGLEETIEDS